MVMIERRRGGSALTSLCSLHLRWTDEGEPPSPRPTRGPRHVQRAASVSFPVSTALPGRLVVRRRFRHRHVRYSNARHLTPRRDPTPARTLPSSMVLCPPPPPFARGAEHWRI